MRYLFTVALYSEYVFFVSGRCAESLAIWVTHTLDTAERNPKSFHTCDKSDVIAAETRAFPPDAGNVVSIHRLGLYAYDFSVVFLSRAQRFCVESAFRPLRGPFLTA